MDNITHSLVGCLIAEGVAQQAPRRFTPSPKFRQKAYWIAIIASNLPDADFFYAAFMGGKLGYLLHHRGHTHTLMAILPGIFLCLLVPYLISRWKGLAWNQREAIWLGGLAGLSLLLHISLDWLNNYGVHPFWPFYNGWFYADTLFIIEPWGWLTLSLPLMVTARTNRSRIAFAAIAFCALAFLWTTPYVWKPAAATVTFIAAVYVLLLRRGISPVGLGTAGFVVMILVFASVSRYVKAQVGARFDLALTDIVLSPHPSNPACWNLHVIEHDLSDVYSVHSGMVSAFPNYVPVKNCKQIKMGMPSTPLLPVLASDRQIRWLGTFARPASQLRQLTEENCQIAALVRFTRVPFWNHLEDGIVAGDIRYDQGQGSFAELRPASRVLASGSEGCPTLVPPWIPPRQDVLEFDPNSVDQTIE